MRSRNGNSAGCTPPANSLIADYFVPRERSQALGFYAMGVTLGTMFANLVGGWVTDAFDWRTAFFYQYNYEPQFPYTPNVRAIRTDRWKYIHYPHGDGNPDRYTAELYDLDSDPLETQNLISVTAHAALLQELKDELQQLMQRHQALPDNLPLDEGIREVLPKY